MNVTLANWRQAPVQPAAAWATGSLTGVFPGLPDPVRLGIHGQHLFVDRRHGIGKTITMVSHIGGALLGH
jgi:hypothetical protein